VKADRSTARRRQSGYAIAAVSFIGMIAMAGAATMLSTAPVAEVAEIEHNLQHVRGHWASVGMLAYTISRGRQDGACDGSCTDGDITRADKSQNYAKEIYNAKPNGLTNKNPNLRRWSYPELKADYYPELRSTVSILNGLLSDGKLVMETVLLDVGPFFGDKHTEAGTADTRAEICTGLAAAGDACHTLLSNTNTSGIARLQDFRIIRP